jgi:hypothetical protein
VVDCTDDELGAFIALGSLLHWPNVDAGGLEALLEEGGAEVAVTVSSDGAADGDGGGKADCG